jgi:D-sedoheptulose 7-phosphate isomerase
MISTAWLENKNIFVAGNGGSASQSDHFVAELLGRFKTDSDPISAVSLSSNNSVLTAIANDFSFSEVFSRQLDGLAKEGDVVILFSTSGTSRNIVNAAKMANFIGAKVISFVGNNSSELILLSDLLIEVPLKEVDTIQEVHLILSHAICENLENYRI